MLRVTAITFDGRKTAHKALNTLEEQTQLRWIDDVAEVSRGKHGFTKIHSTWAQDDSDITGGIGLGAVTGGLLGAMMGPQGALAGALGGASIGGLAGTTLDIALDDPRLDDLAAALKDDSSALVLVSDEPTAADFISATEPFSGTLIQSDLNEKDIKALRKALKS